MNKDEAIRFAGLMEEYLIIPSFVCEGIENYLINGKYKETIEYVVQRRNEIENKEDYKSYQGVINMYLELKEKIDKATLFINKMLNEGNEYTIIDDLLCLNKILNDKGDEE